MRAATLCAGFAVVILLLLGVYAPTQTTTAAPPPEPLARKTFTIDGTSFAILLPAIDEIRPGAGAASVIVFDLTHGIRLQRQISIGTAPREEGARYDRIVSFAGGGRLEYKVDRDIGGGSGGPIGELTGRMTFGSLVLFVECTDQDGLGYTQPDWCLPYLDRLEIVQS